MIVAFLKRNNYYLPALTVDLPTEDCMVVRLIKGHSLLNLQKFVRTQAIFRNDDVYYEHFTRNQVEEIEELLEESTNRPLKFIDCNGKLVRYIEPDSDGYDYEEDDY